MKQIIDASPDLLKFYQNKADAMKIACLSAENIDRSSIPGTCYYVSENGNDACNGKTPETAIQTLDRVASLSLKAGDAVLFKRGDLFRGRIVAVTGVTYSAYGCGEKPVICVSRQNYADTDLWVKTSLPDVWRCTLPMNNVGLLTFDHDPRTIGKYDVLLGWLLTGHNTDGYRHLENAKDLEFWCNTETGTLYLKCMEANPGKRFKRIEIAEYYHAITAHCGINHVTVDNLHITMAGAHGVSGYNDVYGLEVRNCIFDYIGGSLWHQKHLIRFGNAVEIFGSCHDYRVFNNWIYQIYDTGITHQCNDQSGHDVIQEDVEYRDNLIEYCFWSIEYYNQRNHYGITRNIYVHNNFCRFGGDGWGCKIRKESIPMYSFAQPADETKNYRTENNIFELSSGYIYHHSYFIEPEGALIFRGNTYIQHADGKFAMWGKDHEIAMSNASDFLDHVLHEDDYTLISVK